MQSLGSKRVGHDLATEQVYIYDFGDGSVAKNPPANAGDIHSLPGLRKIPWRRAWQPTLVFSPGESHEQKSLVGYSPMSHKALDMTEAAEHTHTTD